MSKTNLTKPAVHAAFVNHLDQPSTTYKANPPLVRGEQVEHVEVCRQCHGDIPLSECVIESHWEKRLKAYRLSEDRAADVRLPGTRESRHAQLTPMDADKMVVGPLVLPKDEKIAEVFAMDALGVSYPKAPTRFWPFPGAVNRSAFIKTGRMGLEYGQEMPS